MGFEGEAGRPFGWPEFYKVFLEHLTHPVYSQCRASPGIGLGRRTTLLTGGWTPKTEPSHSADVTLLPPSDHILQCLH